MAYALYAETWTRICKLDPPQKHNQSGLSSRASSRPSSRETVTESKVSSRSGFRTWRSLDVISSWDKSNARSAGGDEGLRYGAEDLKQWKSDPDVGASPPFDCLA